MTAAARIYELLQDRAVPLPKEADPQDAPPKLDVYFDQAAPGVEDWTAVHEPYLKRARAIIVICTPGAKLNEGREDWVHRELDWWLEHRQMAPILVDPLDEEARYVPDSIANKWPNAQRIQLIEKEWDGLSDEERRSLDERVRARFLGAIIPSGDSFYRQELEQEKQRAARLRRTGRFAIGLAVAFLAVLALAAWIFTLKEAADEAALAADEATVEANVARGEAEAAYQLVQTRVIEGQAARARTEARLLEILQEFDKYRAYLPIFEQWETEFRKRAGSLAASVSDELPKCDEVGGFTVYEGQLVEVDLDEPEPEALFAYLAVVPGSSPRLGDWAPAVLDVFFAARKDVKTGRDLSRIGVKNLIESVAPDDQWGLLMGLGIPHVLTKSGRNYRLSRTNLSMNDEGDMVMTFEICREAGLARN
ncbi:MAG: hypothetical protein GY769_18545 [bacterium]|nr:hypothetical protein [bacterium]